MLPYSANCGGSPSEVVLLECSYDGKVKNSNILSIIKLSILCIFASFFQPLVLDSDLGLSDLRASTHLNCGLGRGMQELFTTG